jgi:hypothetical protein
MPDEKATSSGAFLPASLMYFCSGKPMYFCSGVDIHPTKRADVSRHGYRAVQFEDAFARFLPPEPNIRTLKRGGGERRESVRMFG